MSDVKQALQAKKNNKVASPSTGMKNMLKAMESEIKAALPSMVSSERFQRVALTAFSSNPKLQQCNPTSFLAAMMTSAQLGLEPNTPLGQAYLIPYGTNCQFQIGYKGLLELAQRSGKFKTVYSHAVYENDDFDIEYGLEQTLKHKPNFNDRGEAIGYYAVYKLTNEGEAFIYMTKDEVLRFAKEKSKTFGSGPWQTDFDAMAKKTVIKQLLKYAPISIEIQRALVQDETSKSRVEKEMDLVEEDENVIDITSTTIDEETGEVVEVTQGTNGQSEIKG